MLLSVVGLWVGRGICVGIAVSTSWVTLLTITILGIAVVLLFLGNTKFTVLSIKFLDLRLVD
ncbi:hypothetical protein MetMK1DRAFT_00004730 [Metallosphaera yellowstonensis MK1]|uniref:Transmembrane protein n=1 Tax=Metallosphaera yellowstonensis MK1 TaxID=671065 RepID=H2C122_9CREN|nr:hypothetical protein MetMK1DRAFT_00004730 [Metallosphaera yellowstonensis MK1]